MDDKSILFPWGSPINFRERKEKREKSTKSEKNDHMVVKQREEKNTSQNDNFVLEKSV